jgi:hypothetical protein
MRTRTKRRLEDPDLPERSEQQQEEEEEEQEKHNVVMTLAMHEKNGGMAVFDALQSSISVLQFVLEEVPGRSKALKFYCHKASKGESHS